MMGARPSAFVKAWRALCPHHGGTRPHRIVTWRESPSNPPGYCVRSRNDLLPTVVSMPKRSSPGKITSSSVSLTIRRLSARSTQTATASNSARCARSTAIGAALCDAGRARLRAAEHGPSAAVRIGATRPAFSVAIPRRALSSAAPKERASASVTSAVDRICGSSVGCPRNQRCEAETSCRIPPTTRA